MMQYILALDQGTTSSRAILFDANGSVVDSAQQEYAQHFPQPGWVEHDGRDIWTSQLEVAKTLIQRCPTPSSIAAIAITNQRETTLLWDRKTGQPLGPAIVWQDRRTAEQCAKMRVQGLTELIQTKTGLVLDAYFSGTKLAWLLDHIDGARSRAERGELAFGTVDSWLVWNLTAGASHITDVSNASRTLLFNLHTLDWDDELLTLFNIPRSVLPTVVASAGQLAQSSPSVLGHAIPITAMIGDQQAATFGQGCFKPGMAKNTYGTGCFMLLNTGSVPVASHHHLLTTVGWQRATPPSGALQTTYCLEASVFMGGATIQWLRDGLNIIQTAAEVEALALSVPDVGDTYLVPAFTGLGAPYWDGHARGTLIGMTRGTTKAHIARAALEAIALQVADVFEAMQKDAGLSLSELRVDGGASKNNLLLQMQANILGVPVIRPKIVETTALGAAYLGGLAAGLWSSTDAISALWQEDQRFEPQWSDTERTVKRARWQQAVERAKSWSQD
jgi:glycerol kinase